MHRTAYCGSNGVLIIEVSYVHTIHICVHMYVPVDGHTYLLVFDPHSLVSHQAKEPSLKEHCQRLSILTPLHLQYASSCVLTGKTVAHHQCA